MVQNVREQSIEHLAISIVKSFKQRKLLHLTSISLVRQKALINIKAHPRIRVWFTRLYKQLCCVLLYIEMSFLDKFSSQPGFYVLLVLANTLSLAFTLPTISERIRLITKPFKCLAHVLLPTSQVVYMYIAKRTELLSHNYKAGSYLCG